MRKCSFGLVEDASGLAGKESLVLDFELLANVGQAFPGFMSQCPGGRVLTDVTS